MAATEREEFSYKSEPRTVSKGDAFYTEILSDHLECTYSTRLHSHRRNMLNFFTFHIDENLLPRLVLFTAHLVLYRTDANGTKTIASESKLNYPIPNSIKVSFKDRKEHANTKLEFELSIVIVSRPKFRRSFYDHMFQMKSEENNTALLIEDRVVYVDKELLIASSDYFRCLFSDNFCDNKKSIIPMGLCTFEEFAMLFSTFHEPHIDDIKDYQVELLLDLADRFQLTIAVDNIIDHLIHTSNISRAKVLWLAEQYHLPALIDGVVNTICRHDFRMIKYRRFYSELSDETKKKLDQIQRYKTLDQIHFF